MAELVGCETCRGVGKIVALGNFKEKCGSCLGVGLVNKVSSKDEDEFLKNEDKNLDGAEPLLENVLRETSPKKRGRQKKVA